MQETCEIGPFILDMQLGRLTEEGRHVSVGSRAMDVLMALASRRGEFVSKEALLRSAWNGRTVEENNIAAQIAALRKLLGTACDGASWIETSSGRGYRLLPSFPHRVSPPRLPAPMAQKLSFCSAPDGTRIAVAETGSGPPLVRVGLWMTHLEFEWHTRIWAPLLHRLSSSTRLVRYDQRGSGLSQREVKSVSIERSVADLKAVLDHADLDRTSLLGMSQGAPVAIRFAALYPERVDRLILHGGFAKGWRLQADREALERGEALIALTRHGWGRNNPSFRQVFTSLGFPQGSREDFDDYNELQLRSVAPEMAAAIIDALGEVDVRGDLPRVRAPTQIVHALRDAWVPLSAGQLLASVIPDARFTGLATSSHLPIPPDPEWEKMVETFLTFLEA